jgi:hypothetical protein
LQFLEHALQVFLFFFDLAYVLHLITFILLLLVLLLISHLLLLLLMKLLFLNHVCLGSASLTSNIVRVELVLILDVLDLLDVDFDLAAVRLLVSACPHRSS